MLKQIFSREGEHHITDKEMVNVDGGDVCGCEGVIARHVMSGSDIKMAGAGVRRSHYTALPACTEASKTGSSSASSN